MSPNLLIQSPDFNLYINHPWSLCGHDSFQRKKKFLSLESRLLKNKYDTQSHSSTWGAAALETAEGQIVQKQKDLERRLAPGAECHIHDFCSMSDTEKEASQMKESRAIHRIGFPWDDKILVGIPRVGLVGTKQNPMEGILMK